jgi:hypothetical protein
MGRYFFVPRSTFSAICSRTADQSSLKGAHPGLVKRDPDLYLSGQQHQWPESANGRECRASVGDGTATLGHMRLARGDHAGEGEATKMLGPAGGIGKPPHRDVAQGLLGFL